MAISAVATALVVPAIALADTSDYQAENMTWPAGSGQVYGPNSPSRVDRANPNESGYFLWNAAQGPLDTVTTTQPIDGISVRVRSDEGTAPGAFGLQLGLNQCKPGTQFQLLVDGSVRATWTVAPSNAYTTFTADAASPGTTAELPPGSHAIAVKLLNGHDTDPNCNRSLYVDKYTLRWSHVFPASNWRNTPLADTAPLADASAQSMVGNLVNQVTTYGTWVEKGDRYNVPVYTVPASQPGVPVKLDSSRYTTWWGSDGEEWNREFSSVPIPSYAKASGPSDCSSDGEYQGIWGVLTTCNSDQSNWADREIVVYQPATDTAWEFLHLVKYNGAWTATDGGRISNLSQARQYDSQPLVNSGFFHGVAASRIPLLATLQRTDEVLNGAIHHPIQLTLPHVLGTFADRQHQRSPAVAPALASDGDFATPDAIPEGTRFRLPRSVDVDSLGLGPYARIFAHAAQDYGLIVTDKGCTAPDPSGPQPAGDPCTQQGASVGTSVEDPYPAYGSARDPYAGVIDSAPGSPDGSSDALNGFPWGKLVVVAPTGP